MKKTIYTFLLLLFAITGNAQQLIPSLVKAPEGSKLVLHAYAKGVQIYRCAQDVKDTSKYIWIFQEPRADLFGSSAYVQKIGMHFLNATKNPTWVLSDGGTVSATKLQQVTSPDSLSIPWLLLRTVDGSENGRLAHITYIQRIYTSGGVPAKKASPAKKGELLEVPYTAEYLFYK